MDGSQITYPGAYLRYRVDATGVRNVLDLAGPDAPASYTFRLSPVDKADPLRVQRRPDGSYRVNAGFVLDAPAVWEGDAAAPASQARPALTVVPSGNDLLVTVSLDAAWLRAPGRRFPVHLDPTITVKPDVRHATYKTVAGSGSGRRRSRQWPARLGIRSAVDGHAASHRRRLQDGGRRDL